MTFLENFASQSKFVRTNDLQNSVSAKLRKTYVFLEIDTTDALFSPILHVHVKTSFVITRHRAYFKSFWRVAFDLWAFGNVMMNCVAY